VAKTAVGAVTAAATFDLAAHWIISAAQKITAVIVAAITSSTSPDLESAWFERSFAPMAALGGALALLSHSMTDEAIVRILNNAIGSVQAGELHHDGMNPSP